MAKINRKRDLDEHLFMYFHEGKERDFLEDALREAGVSPNKLKEALTAHYYLSPLNIIKSQKLLALLTVFLAVTITSIRANTDWFLVGLSFVTGLALCSPFVAISAIMIKLEQLESLQNLSYISFTYACFLALLFALMAVITGIYGAVMIPVLILILYVLELRKLAHLRKKLATYKRKH